MAPHGAASPVDEQRRVSEANAWLKAIVDNSDDAILSKTLDGVITTWNRGAERLFGYTAAEAVGQPITIVIPEERLSEEAEILRRLRAGERIDHFETVRRRKDGGLVEISLTVSPVRSEITGEILGASKIARDITEQRRVSAEQAILLREMNHRVKNLFSIATGLVSLSARTSGTVSALAGDLTARLRALARAHELTLPDLTKDEAVSRATTVLALLQSILAPHRQEEEARIRVEGADAPLSGNALTSLALLLHELATNAVKYGALSLPEGRLSIVLSLEGETLRIDWEESDGPPVDEDGVRRHGFGTTLEQAALRAMDGRIARVWKPRGVAITLVLPLAGLAGSQG